MHEKLKLTSSLHPLSYLFNFYKSWLEFESRILNKIRENKIQLADLKIWIDQQLAWYIKWDPLFR